MVATLDTEDQVNETAGKSRRKVIKLLTLVAATGYLAPKAVMISEPWACDKANMTSPHGPNTSGPFC